ncbi:MAG: IS66 family transposase [Planctomycetota bacterium]
MKLEKLPDDVAKLKEIIVSQSVHHLEKKQHYQSEIDRHQTQIDRLHEQIRFLRSKLFGRKTEKYVESGEDQLRLFDEIEDAASAKEVDKQAVPVAAYKRKKRGRKPLPEDLPRIEKIHDLPEEEKVCACGCELTKIGEEVSEKLDYIPAKLQVIKHIRYKYACKGCEGVDSDGGAVKIAPPPVQIIPKGIATPGLLAQILVSKFCDALPFYRQEKIFARLGIDLPRATMANWAIKVSKQCRPLMQILRSEILSGPLVNIDETTVQVLKEPNRNNTSKSYMWIFRGGPPDSPALVFQYHPTRSGQVPKDFLNDYQGYIQTDGYSGYDALGLKEGIVHLGCWAHVRRKFFEVVQARQKNSRQKSKAGSGDVALSYIKKLYRLESIAKERQYSAEQIQDLRQEQANPILEEFRAWLEKRSVQTPPKGLLGKAIAYAMNQWPRLIIYLQDGRLRPDNNLTENAIRPFVIGRKNWLFSGHPRGAEASACIYSLIETAKANRLEPYLYFRFLFDRLPFAANEDYFKSLLPQYLDRVDYLHDPLGAVH